jgi:hypothetical protein
MLRVRQEQAGVGAGTQAISSMATWPGLDSTGGGLDSRSTAYRGVRFAAARSIHNDLIFAGRKLDSVGLTLKIESSRIKAVAGFPLDSARLLLRS